jgi:hypothetical protein
MPCTPAAPNALSATNVTSSSFGANRMLHRELLPDMLGGGHRFDYETEALIIASRKGYRIESIPITTVYTDQVSKIHPGRDALRFFKLMRRYKAVGS